MLSPGSSRLLMALLLLLSCCALLMTAQGCGGKSPAALEQPDTRATVPSTVPSSSKATPGTEPVTTQPQTKTTPSQTTVPDSEAAVKAAKASAQANSPGIGALNVLDEKVVGSWARVDMEPVNKSTDGASWLLKKTNGTWAVVDFGTSIMPADHPDAPASVFE